MNSGRSYYFLFILNVHIHKYNWMHCFWMIWIWPCDWLYLWSNRLCVPPLQQFCLVQCIYISLKSWRRTWYYVHWIGFLNDDLPLFTWYIFHCYIHLGILTIIHGTILLLYVHWIGFLNDDLPLFTWYIFHCYIHLGILTIIRGAILLSFKSYLKQHYQLLSF
jgi:hypothetical protein